MTCPSLTRCLTQVPTCLRHAWTLQGPFSPLSFSLTEDHCSQKREREAGGKGYMCSQGILPQGHPLCQSLWPQLTVVSDHTRWAPGQAVSPTGLTTSCVNSPPAASAQDSDQDSGQQELAKGRLHRPTLCPSLVPSQPQLPSSCSSLGHPLLARQQHFPLQSSGPLQAPRGQYPTSAPIQK